MLEGLNEKPTSAQFFKLAGRIKARFYSICSSQLESPDVLQICATTSILRNRNKTLGLCTGFFKEIYEKFNKNEIKQYHIKASFMESCFKLPTEKNTPLVLVCAGSGIAPFRGIMREKMYLHENNMENPYGKLIFFYGIRRPNEDFLFRDEFVEAGKKRLCKAYMAYSQKNDSKMYCQDLLRKKFKEAVDVLSSDKGNVYVCGMTKMVKSTFDVLKDPVVKMICMQKQGEDNSSDILFEQYKRENRITAEIFGLDAS